MAFILQLFGAAAVCSDISHPEVEALCYICFQTASPEGEVCERACDFCRGSNVHLSCLLQFHESTQAEKPKCPTCRGSLGTKFCVCFFSNQLAALENKHR